jgi:hypothetical protein
MYISIKNGKIVGSSTRKIKIGDAVNIQISNEVFAEYQKTGQDIGDDGTLFEGARFEETQKENLKKIYLDKKSLLDKKENSLRNLNKMQDPLDPDDNITALIEDLEVEIAGIGLEMKAMIAPAIKAYGLKEIKDII